MVRTKKFQFKLWRVVNNCRSGSVKWSKTGDSVIFNFPLFKKEYLDPNNDFCKSSNISSFIRQLNLYGFKKMIDLTRSSQIFEGEKEYMHPNFVKGRQDLLEQVMRSPFNATNLLGINIKQEIFSDDEDVKENEPNCNQSNKASKPFINTKYAAFATFYEPKRRSRKLNRSKAFEFYGDRKENKRECVSGKKCFEFKERANGHLQTLQDISNFKFNKVVKKENIEENSNKLKQFQNPGNHQYRLFEENESYTQDLPSLQRHSSTKEEPTATVSSPPISPPSNHIPEPTKEPISAAPEPPVVPQPRSPIFSCAHMSSIDEYTPITPYILQLISADCDKDDGVFIREEAKDLLLSQAFWARENNDIGVCETCNRKVHRKL